MVRLLTRIFRKQDDVVEKYNIDLVELSELWLRYNKTFTPQIIEKTEEVDLDVLYAPNDTSEKNPVPAQSDVNPKASTSEITPDPTAGIVSLETKQPSAANLALHTETTTFFKNYIVPYEQLFSAQGVLTGVRKLIEFIDKHGNCPSIVTNQASLDSDVELYSIKKVLEQVSLKSHSYRVCQNSFKLLKQQFRDNDNMIPRIIITALAHDIGKIPELRESGVYGKGQHPVISAAKLSEIFAGTDIVWFKGAVESVKNHHRVSNDQFTRLLKDADTLAREMEVAEVSKNVSIKEWSEWFNATTFLSKIEPYVNVVQTGNKCEAFYYNGIVYCQPDLAYEVARRYSMESRVINLILIRPVEKENALRLVVNSLRKAEALAFDVAEGYIGMYFDVEMLKSKKKMYLIPLVAESVGKIDNFSHKGRNGGLGGFLEMLVNITPSGR